MPVAVLENDVNCAFSPGESASAAPAAKEKVNKNVSTKDSRRMWELGFFIMPDFSFPKEYLPTQRYYNAFLLIYDHILYHRPFISSIEKRNFIADFTFK